MCAAGSSRVMAAPPPDIVHALQPAGSRQGRVMQISKHTFTTAAADFHAMQFSGRQQ
jgi:hypothetical protein